ncbi:hypothetical protein SELMODRAFT_116244 [Selaginella moellendorffii]|uniref:Uncharacterized protein n=1 Tax=Selaginella moellendorffii TaxID=88036 RepID=D8SG91_SELML|nr:hypothetical protein SELMODRAFT_116244 [Selaginella moellendorffii]
MAASQVLNFWPTMFGLRHHYPLTIKGVDHHHQEETRARSFCRQFRCTRRSHIVDCIDNGWPDGHKLLPYDPYQKAGQISVTGR